MKNMKLKNMKNKNKNQSDLEIDKLDKQDAETIETIELKKSYKRQKRLFVIFIVVIILLGFGYAKNTFFRSTIGVPDDSNYTDIRVITMSYNQTCNQTISIPIKSETGEITQGVINFFRDFVSMPFSFWTKLLILLGFLYLMQIIFAGVFDIVQLALLTGVGIWRMGKWVNRKLFSQSKNERRLND